MIGYVRPIVESGRVIDWHWFCCRLCWLDSLDRDPPTDAYPEGYALSRVVPSLPETTGCGSCLVGFDDPEQFEDRPLHWRSIPA